MKVLILAGGFGTRLKEVISDRPKVMAPINGKPFLEYVIQLLRRNGIKEIVISLGYLGDYIKAYFGDGTNFGVKIEYVVEDFPLGTGGAIKNAQSFFKEPFLVVNGDTYLETDLRHLIAFHNDKKSLATIALAVINNVGESGLVSLLKSGKIKSFKEKPKSGKRGLVNAGYYFFSPKIFKYIPAKKRLSLEKIVFPKLVSSGLIHGFAINADFLDIGKPETYEKGKTYFQMKKEVVVEANAPVRICFAGSGTDLPEYFRKYGGRIFSATIGMFAHVKIRLTDQAFIKIHLKDYKREELYQIGKILPYDGGIFDLYKAVINRLDPDLGMDIEVWGDFPAGTGLGSSSAVCTAFIAAILSLMKEDFTKEKIAKLTIEIERDILKIPGGWQDQYAASYGGFNLFDFLVNGEVKVKPLKFSEKITKKLAKSLLLFYIGAKRSEKEQQVVLRKNIKFDKSLESFEILKSLTKSSAASVKRGDIKSFGKTLYGVWQAKKSTSSAISNRRIDELVETVMKNSAYGCKVLGAGGGGCLLVSAPTKSQTSIIRNLKKRGVILLPLDFDRQGVYVTSNEN
jgi:galactokinase/mevalonate kinase-like predicted kinase/dTDP-glucose pyrophosphorylase